MRIVRRLFIGDSEDSDFRDREYGPASRKGSGQHDNHVNPHPKEIYADTEIGLTRHEKECFEMWLLHGRRDGAALMDMNKHTFGKIVQIAKEKMGVSGDVNDLWRWYNDEYGAPVDTSIVDTTDEADTSEHSDAYTDLTVPGGDNPWEYDGDGNYIGPDYTRSDD